MLKVYRVMQYMNSLNKFIAEVILECGSSVFMMLIIPGERIQCLDMYYTIVGFEEGSEVR